MRDQILKKLKKDIKKYGYIVVAANIKLPYGNLYRVAKGEGTCTMKTWEKIENYYLLFPDQKGART